MNDDAADVVRVLEADVRPGLAGIGGLVDAVAEVGAARVVGFAGADIDVSGADCASATAPMDATVGLSKTCVNATPPFVVFQRPPVALAA